MAHGGNLESFDAHASELRLRDGIVNRFRGASFYGLLADVEFLLVCMSREARKLDATTEKRERSFGSFVGFKRIFEFSRWV
jgi:hypothetical protein